MYTVKLVSYMQDPKQTITTAYATSHYSVIEKETFISITIHRDGKDSIEVVMGDTSGGVYFGVLPHTCDICFIENNEGKTINKYYCHWGQTD